AVVLFLDELQVLDTQSLAALIRAFHVAAQDLLPITMVAAGSPQIVAKMGEAKTYAERLFEFAQIGRLEESAAIQALAVPAQKLGVRYTRNALKEILKQPKAMRIFCKNGGNTPGK
ncbi:MAG: ATP-binding protein, partial [Coxiella burnetii]|nr:ATP-binding protein [Coxiella burnetii]